MGVDGVVSTDPPPLPLLLLLLLLAAARDCMGIAGCDSNYSGVFKGKRAAVAFIF